jgi:hypothetical protein
MRTRTQFCNPIEGNQLRQSPDSRAAESGAVDAREAPIDPDLQAVIEAWPGLPEAVKAKVIELVQAANPGP